MKHRITVWIVLLLGVIATGCTSQSDSQTAPTDTQGGQGSGASPVGVVMREFEFEPKPLKVKAGTVRFLLMNRGSVEHDFAIPSLDKHNVHEQHLVQPGKTRIVEIELNPGIYEAICTIPGHKDAGMSVAIEVGP